MQPLQILPIERAIDQQSPGQQSDLLSDLGMLVSAVLVANHNGQWDSIGDHLHSILQIMNERSLLRSHISQIECLMTAIPDHLAKEKIILIRQLANYFSLQPLVHRFGRDGLGHLVRWESDFLLSMQWLQAGIILTKTIGDQEVLKQLYIQADQLFTRFVVLEVLEDATWIGSIQAAGYQIHQDAWRANHKILDYVKRLKQYCHADHFRAVIHQLLSHITESISTSQSLVQRVLPYRAEALAIWESPIDEGERIQIVKSCQESTTAFRKDLTTIANESDLSVRAKQIAIFNRYRRYFQETFVPHLKALLGPSPSPCRYHVVAMGSVGREEITPLVDLECCILMEEKKLTKEEKNRDNRRTLEEIYRRENEENRRYFKKMGRLLELLILSIGEWFSTTIPPLGLQGENLMKGFHIDPTKGTEEELWESNVLVTTIDEAKALILKKDSPSYSEEEFAKYGNDKGGNCYSLLKSAPLYSSEASEELFQNYQREIEQLLRSPLSSEENVKTCGEKIIRYTLQKRCEEFSRYRGYVLHGTVDLKEIIFRPFTLLLTDLHTYLSGNRNSTATLSKTNTIELIDELTPLFSLESLNLLRILAQELQSLRINLHTYYGVACGAVKDEASFDGASLTHYTLTFQQQRVIRITHELVLQPLYAKIEEIISRGYALSSIDLIHEGVEGVLKLFQQGKNDDLNHRFCLWITLPISLQFSFYRALSSVGADEYLREIFIDDIEKMLPKEQFEVFLQVPHSMTGYRQKERIARRDLQQAILAITTTAEETPYLVVTPFIHEPRYLKQTVAEQVIDKGDLKADPKYTAVSGNRVCSLSYEEVNLHLKQAPAKNNGSPFFPGKEQGVNRLMMRLFGRGCSFSELIHLSNTSTQKGHFVLISQTVFGVNLNEIIENSPALAQVDSKQLTELFLSIPLVLPGDHRPVNFMVESTIEAAGQTHSQLICVDNDVAWVRPIQAEENIFKQIKYTINIYAPLFFLFPNFTLDQEAIKEFLLLRPTSLLKAWFEDMIALNASYEQTFKNYLPSVIFPYFALEKGMGGQLFVQFCHLQSYLQKHFDRAVQAEELFNTFISYGAGHSVDVGKMLFEKYTTEKDTAGSISEKVKRITGRDSKKSLSLSQSTKAMFSHLTLDADILRPDQSIKELNFLSLYIDKIRIVQQENDLYKVERGFSEVICPDGNSDLATQTALIDTIAAITCDKLDLSYSPALTDVALIRILKTSGHHLTYLNLTECSSITDQSISLLAEHCPRLEELYLSGCANLTMFGSKNVFGLATWPELFLLKTLHIARCPKLTTLYLRSYALMTIKADNNPNLTDVDLDTLKKPETYFDHCPKLKQEWSSKLADRITRYHKEYSMEICHICARLYQNDSSITKLDLASSNISAASVAYLSQALQRSSSVTELNLWFNNIGNNGATSLAKALQHNSSLIELNLRHNNIGAAGVTSLAAALEHNSSLTMLNLASNNINYNGATSLAKTLQHNSSLKTLDLRENNIDTGGIASLAKALQHNSSLTTLHLENNRIDKSGITYNIASLAKALQHNSSLTTLHLENNHIDKSGIAYNIDKASTAYCKKIESILDRNKQIKFKYTNQKSSQQQTSSFSSTTISSSSSQFLSFSSNTSYSFGEVASPILIQPPRLYGLPSSRATSSGASSSRQDDRFEGNALTRSEDLSYWYQATDLFCIQKALFPKEGSPLSPLGIDQLHQETSRMQALSNGEWVAGCYNQGGNHWIAYAILKEVGTVIVLYKDSLDGKIEQGFHDFLTNLFASSQAEVRWVQSDSFEQTDGASCGVFALQNLCIMTKELSQNKASFVEQFACFERFCTQQKADSLRRKNFPRGFVKGTVQLLQEEKTSEIKRTAIEEHHHKELLSLATQLNHLPYTITQVSRQTPFDRNQSNTIGFEIESAKDTPSTPYAYCYRINLSQDLNLKEIQTHLQQIWPHYVAITEDRIIKIDPHFTNIPLMPRLETFPPSSDFTDEELFDKLEATSPILQEKAKTFMAR